MFWQVASGFSFSVVSFFLRYALKTVPTPVAWAGVTAGALVVILGLLPNHEQFPIGPVILFVLSASGLVGSMVWFFMSPLQPIAAGKTEVAVADKPTIDQSIHAPNMTGGAINQTNNNVVNNFGAVAALTFLGEPTFEDKPDGGLKTTVRVNIAGRPSRVAFEAQGSNVKSMDIQQPGPMSRKDMVMKNRNALAVFESFADPNGRYDIVIETSTQVKPKLVYELTP